MYRYPYVPAGKVASPIYAVFGAVLAIGIASHYRTTGALIFGLVGAAVGASAGFTVFASQARERPSVLWQAVVADGVVAGIVTGVLLGLVIALISGNAGTSHSSAHLGRDTLAAMAAGAGVGALGGAVLGYVSLLIGGEDRLLRNPPVASRKRNEKRRSRPRRK